MVFGCTYGPRAGILEGFCCRVSWPIFLALRRHEGILPIPRSGDGTTLAAVLVTTPQARATPSSQQPPAPNPIATPLLAAARAQYPRVPGRPLCGGASGGYLARLGLGGRLLPSYHASRLRARVIVSRSLRLRPCVVPPRASSCHGRAAAAVPSTGGLSDRYCPHQTPASSALPFPRSGRLLAKLKSVVCFLASSRSPNCLDVVYLGSFHV